MENVLSLKDFQDAKFDKAMLKKIMNLEIGQVYEIQHTLVNGEVHNVQVIRKDEGYVIVGLEELTQAIDRVLAEQAEERNNE